MPLTDVAVRKAAARDKPYKMSDGRGLYIHISVVGSKTWRLKYRFQGAEKILTFGPYPEVKLAEARGMADEARRTLRAGKNPKDAPGDGVKFETAAADWIKRERKRWSPTHASDVEKSINNEVLPTIGHLALSEISVKNVAGLVAAIEERGAEETARRVRQRIEAIFTYAMAKGLTETNPAAAARGALSPKPAVRPQPALVSLDEVREMLSKAMATPAQMVARTALLVLAATAVRPGELRHAQWQEFDLDKALWTIPSERMKGRLDRKMAGEDHLVPLVPVVVAALHDLKRLTGEGPLAFPSIRDAGKPMSENTVGYLLNRAGYHGRQTAHGFRASFSSIMNERFPADRAVIDAMLAHKPQGVSGSETAYNRSAHHDRRRQLAEAWAELLGPSLSLG